MAQEVVYRPINPSFGGHPLNSSHLLGLAERQNPYKEDRHSPFGSGSTDQFQRQIQSALLSRVASEIADQILGEDAAETGTFQIDSTTISFERVGDNVSVTILDGLSGGETVITIPAPTF